MAVRENGTAISFYIVQKSNTIFNDLGEVIMNLAIFQWIYNHYWFNREVKFQKWSFPGFMPGEGPNVCKTKVLQPSHPATSNNDKIYVSGKWLQETGVTTGQLTLLGRQFVLCTTSPAVPDHKIARQMQASILHPLRQLRRLGWTAFMSRFIPSAAEETVSRFRPVILKGQQSISEFEWCVTLKAICRWCCYQTAWVHLESAVDTESLGE